MEKKKILFVSIAFPPKNDPECLQTMKYFDQLLMSNEFDITVVTSKNPTLNMPVDSNISFDLDKVDQLIEVNIYENKYLNYLFRKFFIPLIEKPDSKWSFHWQSKFVIRSLDRTPQIIYSRSSPLSSTIMALKLKEYYNIPWVLHLSDPWVDNPLHQYSKKGEAYNEKMERICFAKADTICLTSKLAISFYTKKYPDFFNKFFYMPNVFDKIEDKSTNLGKTLRFVYTGGLVGSRSPIPLLEAIKILYKENKLLFENVEFIFAGQLDRVNRPAFENDLEFVKHLGLLGYNEAKRLQKDASVLLVIDSPISREEEAMFFPSKILDYMSVRKPILAITDNNSETYNVITHANVGFCFSHDDLDGIKRFILKTIDAFRMGNEDYFSISGNFDQFSVTFNTKRLIQKFKEIED